MVRIAIASTDGKLINQHFGRADKFYILDIEEEDKKYRVAEIRTNIPACERGDHEEAKLKEMVNNLADCSMVLVSRIGMRARREFEELHIEVFEAPGIIDEAVDGILRYRKIQNLFH